MRGDQARRKGRGARGQPPIPFWRQKRFLSVSFVRKLIVHEYLNLKLFGSSKMVDYSVIFATFSGPGGGLLPFKIINIFSSPKKII